MWRTVALVVGVLAAEPMAHAEVKVETTHAFSKLYCGMRWEACNSQMRTLVAREYGLASPHAIEDAVAAAVLLQHGLSSSLGATGRGLALSVSAGFVLDSDVVIGSHEPALILGGSLGLGDAPEPRLRLAAEGFYGQGEGPVGTVRAGVYLTLHAVRSRGRWAGLFVRTGGSYVWWREELDGQVIKTATFMALYGGERRLVMNLIGGTRKRLHVFAAPLEVSTGIRLAQLALYGGGAVDLVGATGTIKYVRDGTISHGELIAASVSGAEVARASGFYPVLRALAGAQLTLGSVAVFAQGNASRPFGVSVSVGGRASF